MLLYLIRHTPVAVDDGVCYGRSDVDLADDWPHRLEQVAKKLPAGSITGKNLYTSPLTRCRTLADRLGPGAQSSDLLREMDFGSWEGRRWDSIPRSDIDAWLADLVSYRAPGGESLGDVSQRCVRFLQQLRAQAHENVIVVTHGGVVRCLVAHALGMPLNNGNHWAVQFSA